MARRSLDSTTINTQAVALSPMETLELFYCGHSLTLTRDDVPYAIGRDGAAALVVDDDMVSRHHCRIDYYEDKFILVDASTNGTWVQISRARPVRVHHESTPLSGSGAICLGRPLSLDDPALIRFKV